MKKAFYFLFIALSISTAAIAQTSWVKLNLGPNFSVKLPGTPQKVSNGGIDVYIIKDKDSIGYIANIVDFQAVANLDSTTLASMKDMPEFADQLKMGLASSMQNFDLGDVTISKWNGFTTYYITGIGKQKKDRVLALMILIGSKMYTLSCIIPDKIVTKNNEVYFASAEWVK